MVATRQRHAAFTTATGESISVGSHREVFLPGDWSGRFFYREISDVRVFEIQPRGHGLLILDHGSPTKVTDEWVGDGGRFMIAHDPDTEANLAIWSGRHHDLVSWVMGPVPMRRQVQKLYDALSWRDTPSGISVSMRYPNRGGRIEQQEYLVGTTDGALLSVRDPRSFGDMTPKGAGAKTRNGEVWKRRIERSDGTVGSYYALGTPTALTVYYPKGAGVAESVDLDVLDNLSVSWGT
ncbi:hypothetical protein ACOCJ7_03790 [Knoellia sp. CPCC 206453]|uniref:hypothetical protein n=1 Tax=Knoellia pratensis TaxID=3404796 RepID=UPI0036229F83